MPKFVVPYEWAVCGGVEVEADNLECAIQLVEDMDLDMLEMYYIDGSFNIDPEMTALLNEDMRDAR